MFSGTSMSQLEARFGYYFHLFLSSDRYLMLVCSTTTYCRNKCCFNWLVLINIIVESKCGFGVLQYNFEGGNDLVKFVKLVGEAGLYVILRIGPYVCAEWNYG